MRTKNVLCNPLLTVTAVLALLVLAGPRPVDASLVSSDNIYFGHLHNHSTLSGATGTPDEAYLAAQAAGLDFFGLTDHGESLNTSAYDSMKTAANAHQADGTFTTFYGFEWSSSNYGHVAVVNCSEYCSANSQPTFDALLAWLATRGCVAFCNHPGRQNGAGTEFDHFTDSPSSTIVGMELWNKTIGFGTYYDNNGYTSDSRDRSGYFDEALFNGWKIGAAGSRDEHSGAWGGGSFRLAILAGANTRTALYNALKARNFYSTLDENLELSFSVDGSEMGASIAGGLSHCVVKAADRDGETFSLVEVIHNGYVVYTADVTGQALPVASCNVATRKGDYLYCMVTENDGDEAISSPVFITSDGPDGPPRADLSVPLDNGPADFEPAPDVVKVNTTQPNFQIQLSDFDGIDDFSATATTVSIAGLTSGVDYSFTYSPAVDTITLAPLASTVFGDGTYTITVSGIRDLVHETMTTPTVLIVEIDTSIVLPQTVHFQDGLNGYLGTVDTMICGAASVAGTSFGADTSLNVDTYDLYGGVSQVLVRFGTIIGEGAGQIPPGASISSATLRLRSLDTGNGGSLHAMLQPWSSGSTWNSLVNGVTANNAEALSAADDGISANTVGDVDLDVAGTVQSWADGLLENNGWVVLPNGTDGWHIASCEYATADYRPELIVTFTPGTGGPDNHPPFAADDSATTNEDTAVTISVLTNDSDPDGDSLTVTDVTAPAHGSAVINGGTTVTYTPAAGYIGTDSFDYTISDSRGGTATATVHITVRAVNGNPVAGNDSPTTNEDTAVTVSVLANDSDPDGDSLAVTGVTTPAHGTAAVNAATTVTYTPAANYNGPDSFTYTVSDGKGGTATATVNVTILPVNDNPVAGNDSATTRQNTAVTIAVLSNDSDVDGDALTVSAIAAAAHGTVANGGTSVTYTPASGYAGPDSFTYTVSDGKGGTATATVSVTVTEPAPTVSVSNIAMSVIAGKKYKATATVTLTASLQGATVVGDWYFKGTIRAGGVTATLGSGGYLFTSPEVPAKPGNEFKFVVTDVVHSTYRFAPDPSKDVATIAVGQ